MGPQGFSDNNIKVIPNAKLSHWGSRPMQGPNTKGFALQWYLGFKVYILIFPRNVANTKFGQRDGCRKLRNSHKKIMEILFATSMGAL